MGDKRNVRSVNKGNTGTKPSGRLNIITSDNAFILALCIIIPLLVYNYSAFHNQFTNWDDNKYIAENQYIRTWNWELFTATVNANWAPVLTFISAIEYHLFGMNAIGYHATSLLLHLFNIILVFGVILKLSRKKVVAGIVALFFAIHPMHVESVSWISSQKDLLYTLFYLAAMLMYLSYLEYQSNKNNLRNVYLLLTMVFFILSCLSKGMGETLPVVLVLIDCYWEHNWNWKFILRSATKKIVFFFLSIAFGITAFLALKHAGALEDNLGNTLIEQMMFACYGIVVYIVKFVFPFPLSPLYLYPMKNAADVYPVIFYLSPIIILSSASAIALLIWKKKISESKNNILLFGLLFFITNLVLVLQLKTLNFVMLAERYTYLSYVGLLFITAEAVNSFWEKHVREYKNVMLGIYFLIALIFATIANSYTAIWHDSVTLWTRVIDISQSIPLKHLTVAYNNRGLAYVNQGRFDLGIADYTSAISLDSQFTFGYNNRGLAYMKQRKTYMAISDYTKAIKLDSAYASPYYNIGLAYARLGKPDSAIINYTKAIKLTPKFVDIYNDRGLAYMRKGKPDSALSDYNKAISLDPQFVSPYYNRGLLYANLSNPDLAINDFTTAINLDPKYPDTYNDRGLAYMRKGKPNLAIDDFNTAINLNPLFALPYYNRGLLYADQGKFDLAIENYSKTINLNPQYAAAYHYRGVAEEIKGDHLQAQVDFQKATELGWSSEK